MKLIKFDLPINGIKVKNLDELRDNLTDEILMLARSSQLERWLKTRQLPDQAQAVATAVRSEGTDKGLFLALCKVLEVEAHPGDVKAIFDAPPAPGRFIPGARYFKLYEDLKSTLDSKAAEVKNTIYKNDLGEKLFPSYKKILDVKFTNKFFSGLSAFQLFDFANGGKVVNVFVKKGNRVMKGSLVAEVVNRSSFERIYSPVTGYVEKVFFEVGGYIKIGGDLFSVVESEA